MDIDKLNTMIESIISPKLSKFAPNGISSTFIKETGYLYISIRAHTLMFYMRSEKLGEICKEFPELFEMLLTANVSGGRFNNLRLTYDSDTTVLWLCYDIKHEAVTATAIKETAEMFIQNAKDFKKLLNSQLLDVVLKTLKGQDTNKSINEPFEGAHSMLPFDIEQSYAVSFAASYSTAEANFDNNLGVKTAKNGEIVHSQQKEGPVNVMVAQSLFMLA